MFILIDLKIGELKHRHWINANVCKLLLPLLPFAILSLDYFAFKNVHPRMSYACFESKN